MGNMGAWNAAWNVAMPGLVGMVVYISVKILLDNFSPLIRFTVMLIAALVSFASAFIAAKLQGNGWIESLKNGILPTFIFLIFDLRALKRDYKKGMGVVNTVVQKMDKASKK